jgi:hypothetical protein
VIPLISASATWRFPATRHQLERVIALQRALDEGLFIESRKVGGNRPIAQGIAGPN